MTHPMSRTDVRLGLAAAAVVGVIGLIGAGGFMLGGSETSRALGRTLSIAVVPPVEREVLPGETMEVGALSDGFDRAALDRPAEPSIDDGYLPPDAYVGEEGLPRMPMPTPVRQTPMEAYRHVVDQLRIEAKPADPLADGSRAFGFDTPRPDYAAERTARLNRVDAPTQEGAVTATTNAASEPIQYSSE